MDSYQKLNIKWFIFRFLLPKINQKRLDDSKNEEIWKGQGRFALNMVKNDRTWSKSVEIGSMFNQGNYSNAEGSNIFEMQLKEYRQKWSIFEKRRCSQVQ